MTIPAHDPPVRPRLLLVEDDAAARRSIAESVDDEVDVTAVANAEQALASIASVRPDFVLSDVRMPGLDGLALLRLLRERVPGVDVVLMTAYKDMPTVATAMREGAFDFLVKPIRLRDLRSLIQRIMESRRARDVAPPQPTRPLAMSMVGRDSRMIEIYKRVGQVAAGRVTALIRGETGTGKGLIARAIHETSSMATEPFIAINCTAIPEALLESELFGHVRGAFTGAIADRRGRFALAGRGTIFLDEVGDTTPEFQSLLLRVLEEREYFPVGSERGERTEARVIAATHRDLEALVASGRFREDLYYRLRIVEIFLPPLRERPDDIPLLARHFVDKASAQLGRQPPVIGDDALQRLLQHRWRRPRHRRRCATCRVRSFASRGGGQFSIGPCSTLVGRGASRCRCRRHSAACGPLCADARRTQRSGDEHAHR